MLRTIAFVSLAFALGSSRLATAAGSASCAPVHLNAERGPLWDIPIYQQGAAGYCYAVTAATLIDAERKRTGLQRNPADRTNPLYLAWSQATDAGLASRPGQTRHTLDGGSVYNAIRSANRRGVCPDARVRESIRHLMNEGSMTEAEVSVFLDRFNEYAQSSDREEAIQSAWHSTLGGRERALSGRECRLANLNTVLPHSPYEIPLATKLLESFFEDQCPRSVLVPAPFSPVPQLQNHGSDELIRQTLDQSLTAGFPAAVGLCANYLRDTSYSGLGSQRANQMSRMRGAPGDCAKHSVVISGRAPIGSGGQCMYLVRNSWGPDWRGPDSDRLIARRRTPCACKVRSPQGTITYQENCVSVPESRIVEHLGCWFNADQLTQQLGEVVTYHRPDRR